MTDTETPKIPRTVSLIEKELLDEYYPPKTRLCAKYKKGFAYKTIGYRLPVILTKIIDGLSRSKNDIGDKYGLDARSEIKDIVGRLAKLKNELQTNKPISIVQDPIWNEYLDRVAVQLFDGNKGKVSWYLSPWLYVECYLYHRIHNAFNETVHLKNYDYFQSLKEDGFNESIEPAVVLGEYVISTLSEEESTNCILQNLLEITLWGNRCDLSLSCGEENSQQTHLLDQLHSLKNLILADDSKMFWNRLNEKSHNGSKSIGYILDNAGFELFTDLCFADMLISKNKVNKIDFYVKTIPWFVSDAMAHDFQRLVEAMRASEKEPLQTLAQRWTDHINNGSWRIIEKPFWTYPQSYFEMEADDPELYAQLSLYTVLIFKGDLNYRKLVGDINWEPSNPFSEALQGFRPSPLIAIRTCKADTVAGIEANLAAKISATNSEWLITGEFGLIQYSS